MGWSTVPTFPLGKEKMNEGQLETATLDPAPSRSESRGTPGLLSLVFPLAVTVSAEVPGPRGCRAGPVVKGLPQSTALQPRQWRPSLENSHEVAFWHFSVVLNCG